MSAASELSVGAQALAEATSATSDSVKADQADARPQIIAASVEQIFSGPLPHPNLLVEYERALTGAADRILTMAEAQAGHRQRMEKAIIHSRSRDSIAGIVSAFLISLTAVILGTYTILNGHPVAGAIIDVGGLGGLVSAFIYGTREGQKADRSDIKERESSSGDV